MEASLSSKLPGGLNGVEKEDRRRRGFLSQGECKASLVDFVCQTFVSKHPKEFVQTARINSKDEEPVVVASDGPLLPCDESSRPQQHQRCPPSPCPLSSPCPPVAKTRPESASHPKLKTTLTLEWQRWHSTARHFGDSLFDIARHTGLSMQGFHVMRHGL